MEMKTLIIYKFDYNKACILAGKLKNQLESINISSSILPNTKLSETIIEKVDMAIVLGGDGTILRVARCLAGTDIPILSINFGRIGFLSSIEPEDLSDALVKIQNNEYNLGKRLMLDIYMQRGPKQEYLGVALNDAVIRSHIIHPININLRVNREQFVYTGDGVVCATPTGSTAYSYSAGGPIVDSHAQALVITPINPQLSCCRSIVLDVNDTLNFEIASRHPTVMSIDGQREIELQQGDVITIKKSNHTVALVQFQPMSCLRKMVSCLNKSLLS